MLLKELGWEVRVERPLAEEFRISGESPETMVCRLASEKAFSVYNKFRDSFVIGADTIVALDEEILGKPSGLDQAFDMLKKLQGREHCVVTGIALIGPAGRKLVEAEKTLVRFRKLSDDEIFSYIQSGESFDKAGAYAIQGKGMLLAEKINGCYFNVVGLPVQRLSRMLRDMGWPLAEQWGIK